MDWFGHEKRESALNNVLNSLDLITGDNWMYDVGWGRYSIYVQQEIGDALEVEYLLTEDGRERFSLNDTLQVATDRLWLECSQK